MCDTLAANISLEDLRLGEEKEAWYLNWTLTGPASFNFYQVLIATEVIPMFCLANIFLNWKLLMEQLEMLD